MSRQSRRRDEIASLLALRDREGLTYQQLSERCGLATATLSWWSWKLRQEPEPDPTPRSGPAFAELKLIEPDPCSPPSADTTPRRVAVHRAGWKIEVDADLLPELLAALAELPC